MSREELINTLKTVLSEDNETMILILINSAIAYVNGYTFQNYSLDDINSIPHDIFMVILELAENKYHEKAGVESERLADYSITYSSKDLSNECSTLLNRYRIIYVE